MFENGKLNIGILGCANIAKKYAISAFKALDVVDEVYLASRDVAKSKAWSDELGTKFVESYDALIESQDIQAIYIPLPIGLHEEWVIKAAEANKHVLCEKSLAGSYGAVKRMVEACKNNDVVLYENFMCDYHPQHEAVLTLLNQGELGELFTLQSNFGFPPMNKSDFRYTKELGGGCLNDVGAYTVFISRKMFNTEPTAVTCDLHIDPETGVDIQGAAYLEFPLNKYAFFGIGFNNVYQNNYSIWGSKGLLTVKRAFSIPPSMKPDIEMYKNENFQDVFTNVDAPAANHFELIFNDFCNTILTDDKAKREEKYQQILNQAKALEALRISAEKHERVELEEIWAI